MSPIEKEKKEVKLYYKEKEPEGCTKHYTIN